MNQSSHSIVTGILIEKLDHIQRIAQNNALRLNYKSGKTNMLIELPRLVSQYFS